MTVKMTNWLFAAAFCLALLPATVQADGADHDGATINNATALGDIAPEAGYSGDEEQQLIIAVQEAKLFGVKNPRLAASLNMLGAYYYDAGKLAEAEPLYRAALAMAEQADNADPLDIAVCLANLATLYMDLGRDEEATEMFQRALGMWSVAAVPEEQV
ncbi:MAG: tetratricopeptide repeat protein [Alphaproteobacteria bacterium]|jgi:tetratricopeptide (TPR) repeat protein